MGKKKQARTPDPGAQAAEEPTPEVRCLIERLEDGVLVTDGGRLIHANPALERMLGSRAGEIVGRRISELFCDMDGQALPDLAPSDAICLRDTRGGLVPAALRQLGAKTFLVRDRSRESRLEGEIWRLSEELRRTAEPSERHTPLRGEIPGMIEHEIRTASTAVRGYLRMLLDERAGAINPTQRRFLEEARRASGRISALLDNLIEMTTPDAPGALRVVRKSARLHVIVQAAVDATRPLLEDRGVQVCLELEAEDDEVRVDAGQVEQVFINLLVNAAKFGPQGGLVRITTHHLELDGGAWLCFSLQDEGPGVAEEEEAQIFQPFVRGRAAAESDSDGVGLGLAICRKIVEAHAGTIEAVSTLGHGLFRVLLPQGM